MRQAIELSLRNLRESGGGPFAALVVRAGEIIARGTNMVTAMNDPTAHAEIMAIRNGCAALRSFQLAACEIYSTCEPCPMCLGAIFWARPARVFYANTREDAAAIGFDDSLIYSQMALPPSQRQVPMSQILRNEALTAFREWQKKADRVQY